MMIGKGFMENNISQAVIRRMPRYYRYLGELLENGVERISSKELSERMQVTASQIRQDLNNFGGFGQQGYGYNVEFLYEEIGRILGLTKVHNVALFGVGNLGAAIANYVNFEKLPFRMIGLFDVDQKKKDRIVGGIPVMMIDEFEDFIKEHRVDIAVLTLPKDAAMPVAERLVSLGVRAFWNFAHVDLMVPDDMVVENVHLSDSLMQLSYNMSGR